MATDNLQQEKEVNQRQEHFDRSEFRYIRIEIIIWSVAALALPGKNLLKAYQAYIEGINLLEILNKYYEYIGWGLLVFIFPHFYRLIFGMFPFENVRLSKLTNPDDEVKYTSKNSIISMLGLEKQLSVIDCYQQFVKGSEQLSKKILTRSGVYLLIGVFIAFGGVLFFGLQSTTLSGELDYKIYIASMLPRFGILFFIEFIALFFLKQYKSAMDEFRYFESIKRNREEIFCILKYIEDKSHDLKLSDFVKSGNFFSGAGKISAGETTDLIESKKLNKDETELFSKIIDTIKTSKEITAVL